MSVMVKTERETQNRVIKLIQEELGYTYLGNWKDKLDNSNIERDILEGWLVRRGYGTTQIAKAFHIIKNIVDNKNINLYDANKAFYSLLRYGVTVQTSVGQHKETVQLIDWDNPSSNDFSLAEEVSMYGVNNKRPDIILYVNGIALGVLELKRSSVSVSEGIRQNLDNQKHIFIGPLFYTMQLVMAGNDSEGLRYGTINTPEKYYLAWKEVREENLDNPALLTMTASIREKSKKYPILLDKHIVQLLNKERFLELIHGFIVFDKGTKKLCRPNQYFGVKSSQDFIKKGKGGIIWHTQGSGKSLTMVWLAKWINEHYHDGRVLLITDREELDDQIEKVFTGVDEHIYRTTSGRDLLEKLNATAPWLICSLVHKFKGKDEEDVDDYLNDIRSNLPTDFRAKGRMFVFVDECHRTQSGKLHSAMKEILPEDTLFIGFTGTPLLKSDKIASSYQVFGEYIHTYKFDEGVEDGVILDLRYEARDVEQTLGSEEKIDAWFEASTKGMTDHAKDTLKKRWGTLKKLFSSKTRLEKIVTDIIMDMMKRERLSSGHGNALLVSDSIYNACRYYDLFTQAGFNRCAIITSYNPNISDIKGESTGGDGYTEKLKRFEIYQKMLSDYFHEPAQTAIYRIDEFETQVKEMFVEQPAQMKLLIVVDKLLTGFDAPSATYLYIDKSLQNHGLFQAVCRVNRLDGEDKEFGYIVDYKDLFDSLKSAFYDYTTGALSGYEKEDVSGFLKNKIEEGRIRLEESLEAVKALCEPVDAPKGEVEFIEYFVGDTEYKDSLKDTEPQRFALYKIVSTLIRAYANIADDMEEAGYTSQEAETIRNDVAFHESMKRTVELASADYIELKQYEPAMRFLIDSYIGAEESRVLANFDDISLLDLLVNKGDEAVADLPDKIKKNKKAVAEVIEGNYRKEIVDRQITNPAYYAKMSELLDSLIAERKKITEEYEEYLKELIALAPKIQNPEASKQYPARVDTPAKRALYDNFKEDDDLACDVHEAILGSKKDGWRDHKIKLRGVGQAIRAVLTDHEITDINEEQILELAKNQREY
ncbi:MAG: HsdR family type I site-specific deoxyribonuclease [Sphaerochaeta sp.]|nr:HsdR family type I site-specific deoxyribonuclease [Sphaerochaeta sp.]